MGQGAAEEHPLAFGSEICKAAQAVRQAGVKGIAAEIEERRCRVKRGVGDGDGQESVFRQNLEGQQELVAVGIG